MNVTNLNIATEVSFAENIKQYPLKCEPCSFAALTFNFFSVVDIYRRGKAFLFFFSRRLSVLRLYFDRFDFAIAFLQF